MHFPPHVFLFSKKEKPPNSKTERKEEETPKLSISFIERKEMRPNSPLTGNSTVFDEGGCGTDGDHQNRLFS